MLDMHYPRGANMRHKDFMLSKLTPDGCPTPFYRPLAESALDWWLERTGEHTADD
jgi:hypothetical protein